jgi:hypothetical protein
MNGRSFKRLCCWFAAQVARSKAPPSAHWKAMAQRLGLNEVMLIDAEKNVRQVPLAPSLAPDAR